ncbi:MAG: sigma-54 dependent transcriptional regulator [Betaproteobacteria bacterium]
MSVRKESEIGSLIVGDSEAISDIRSIVATYSKSDASVLIRGQTGTGKELVSQALHQNSDRSDKSFQAINCAAIPDQFLESELFGHKRGAFTGSIADRKGRFELADQGTLFLDEIGDMPLDLQVKLLRVLEDGIVQPLGGGEKKVDVRIVAATHRNLEEMIAEGTFREDLFYRLNVLPINIPPLSERTSDIPLLIRHLASKFSKETKPISFSSDSLLILQQYEWPGNIRELSNFIQRFTILLPESEIDLFSINTQFLDPKISLLMAERHDTVKSTSVEIRDDGKNIGDNYTEIIEQSLLEPQEREVAGALVDTDDFEDIIRLSEKIVSIPEEGIESKQILSKLEEDFIRKALIQTNGNVSKASKLLCLGRTTLIQKIEKYEIAT